MESSYAKRLAERARKHQPLGFVLLGAANFRGLILRRLRRLPGIRRPVLADFDGSRPMAWLAARGRLAPKILALVLRRVGREDRLIGSDTASP